jgi:hypothetical protein
MSANAPYSHPGHASYAWGFHEMGMLPYDAPLSYTLTP